ncbi:MAG: putative transporter integral rane protein [Acidimicrobiales bacterium]|nr:putative transporter integral rane protein [Acidimicrobiales bacterium]
MTAVIRAELQRLWRRKPMTLAALGALLFSVVATLTVFSGAPASGPVGPQGGTTLELLGRQGGGTEAFAVGASFIGFFVFVTFIALLASEFSGGTYRALLLRNPHRLQVIIGKLVGILIVAAGVVLLAEVATFIISLLAAPGQDVSTSDWFSAGSAVDAVKDFGTVFAGVAGWAIFGTTLAFVFRSAPLALGVGFAWAGPFENITVDSWTTGYRVFPGQVLRAVINGGTPELGLSRALLTGALYAGVAAAISLLLLARRDVTA